MYVIRADLMVASIKEFTFFEPGFAHLAINVSPLKAGCSKGDKHTIIWFCLQPYRVTGNIDTDCTGTYRLMTMDEMDLAEAIAIVDRSYLSKERTGGWRQKCIAFNLHVARTLNLPRYDRYECFDRDAWNVRHTAAL